MCCKRPNPCRYYDDGWVDFGEFSPDLSRKGWAAAFIPDPSTAPSFGGVLPPAFNRPPSPPSSAYLQAMAQLGINDPSVFPGSRRGRQQQQQPAAAPAPAAAAAATTKALPAVQPPFNIEGQFDGQKSRTGNVHAGLIGGRPQRMPDDVAQKVWKAAIGGDPALSKKVPFLPTFVSSHGVKAAGAAPVAGGGSAAASSAVAATALTPEEIAAKKKEREDKQAAEQAAAAQAAASHAQALTVFTDKQNQRAAKVVQLKQQNMEVAVALSCINRCPCLFLSNVFDDLTRSRAPDCAMTTAL